MAVMVGAFTRQDQISIQPSLRVKSRKAEEKRENISMIGSKVYNYLLQKIEASVTKQNKSLKKPSRPKFPTVA